MTITMNTHGLPPYIYDDNYHRAFLNLQATLRGEWIAVYVMYYKIRMNDGRWVDGCSAYGPDAIGKTPEEACLKLSGLMGAAERHGA